MNRYLRIFMVVLLIGSLVLVRQFEGELFFDPLMAFFQGIYIKGNELPIQWYFNLILRFLLNTAISLAILYFCFQKWSLIKFAGLLYLVLFVVLFPSFVVLMGEVTPEDYLAVFYVRRFLIHPVLLLVLIPAFYYQKTKG